MERKEGGDEMNTHSLAAIVKPVTNPTRRGPISRQIPTIDQPPERISAALGLGNATRVHAARIVPRITNRRVRFIERLVQR